MFDLIGKLATEFGLPYFPPIGKFAMSTMQIPKPATILERIRIARKERDLLKRLYRLAIEAEAFHELQRQGELNSLTENEGVYSEH